MACRSMPARSQAVSASCSPRAIRHGGGTMGWRRIVLGPRTVTGDWSPGGARDGIGDGCACGVADCGAGIVAMPCWYLSVGLDGRDCRCRGDSRRDCQPVFLWQRFDVGGHAGPVERCLDLVFIAVSGAVDRARDCVLVALLLRSSGNGDAGPGASRSGPAPGRCPGASP
jgi:hypothetical protein